MRTRNYFRARILLPLLISTFFLGMIPLKVRATITGDSYPASGNWIIDDDTVVENEIIVWNYSILIQGDADVTFKNTTIFFNSTDEAGRRCRLQSTTNGTVTINNCTITALNHDDLDYYPYTIDIGSNTSFFTLNNSIVEYCGVSWDANFLVKSKAAIVGSSFRNNYHALFLSGMAGPDDERYARVENNTFINQTDYDIRTAGFHNLSFNSNVFLGTNLGLGAGFFIEECKNLTMSNNQLHASTTYWSLSMITDSNNVDVINNTINLLDGRFDLDNCTRVNVSGNSFHNMEYGLFLDACDESQVGRNVFQECYSGLYNDASNDTIVLDNQFINMSHSGIQVRTGSHDCNLTGNEIDGTNEYGVFLYHAIKTIVEDMSITNTSHQGLFNQFSNQTSIMNCLVTECGWSGIDVTGASEISIHGCKLRDNGYCGVSIHDADNVNVTNNNITGSSQAAVRVKQSYNVNLLNNNIVHNYAAGVDVTSYSSAITISGNRISFNEGTGLYIEAESEVTYSENEIRKNGEGNVIDENKFDRWELVGYVIAAAAIATIITLAILLRKRK